MTPTPNYHPHSPCVVTKQDLKAQRDCVATEHAPATTRVSASSGRLVFAATPNGTYVRLQTCESQMIKYDKITFRKSSVTGNTTCSPPSLQNTGCNTKIWLSNTHHSTHRHLLGATYFGAFFTATFPHDTCMSKFRTNMPNSSNPVIGAFSSGIGSAHPVFVAWAIMYSTRVRAKISKMGFHVSKKCPENRFIFSEKAPSHTHHIPHTLPRSMYHP